MENLNPDQQNAPAPAPSEEEITSTIQKMKDAQPPSPEQAAEYQSHVAAVTASQTSAADLQAQASNATDPAQRKSLMSAAADHQIEYLKRNEKLRKLEKGWSQGAVAGGGAGIATGMGIGGTLGAIVGGVVAVPTGLLGTGIGAGVGAWKGPMWEPPKDEEEKKESE